MNMAKSLCLKVTGDFACFTRPEMKVERVSYDVITPSATRAVFEAILWKPEIRWRVTKIEVLKPIQWISVRRNEVSRLASGEHAAGKSDRGIYIEEHRQQRAGLFLKDVAYRLHAEFEVVDGSKHVHRYPELRERFPDEPEESQPENLNTGRSARQMAVYHNILNITGDRLRANPQSTITLVGASDKNPVEGKLMAENIKSYLVKIYGIDGARIITEGRDKPMIPSEQPGGTKELVLLREGDRRVDIESNSPELLLQVGGSTSPFLRPVQIRNVQRDPLDSHVIFYVEGANDLLEGWSVAITDEHGTVQHYGSFTSERASVSGRVILGDNTQGNYKIIMTGKTKTGKTITKESSVSLMKMDDPKQEGLRYSILFDFDKSKTIESYEKFLADVVAPLVPENGTVIIHGHTDIIGEEAYNLKLSQGRAADAQRILSKALNNAGKKGVKFETYGFGKDTNIAPFENNLPEERFYNRAVIIDIIPNK